MRTESGVPGCRPDMLAYLEQEMAAATRRLGATARVLDNPVTGGGPFLIAHRYAAGDQRRAVLAGAMPDVVLAEAHAENWRWTC